ncbi:MAG: monooxygenase, partial [Ramlibacter sp.]|nr:monooxygenase [Ramlibacter sp.]
TTPSPGIALVREAVLSLSTTDNFLSNLFDPYASPPYEYAQTPLNATPAQDDSFAPRCRCGSVAPDVALEQGGRLHEKLGPWFTLLRFSDAQPSTSSASAAGMPLPRHELILPPDSAAGRLYDARPGTVYLLRPDHRIAGRWRDATPGVLERASRVAAGFAHPEKD